MDARGKRELNLRVVHLLDKSSAGFASFDRLHTDDLDTVSPGSVTSTHVAVALGDGGRHSHIPVFAVHVVGARPRIITKPNTKVLDLQGLVFSDFFDTDDLTSGLLELPQLTQEIPKPKKTQGLERQWTH